MRRKQSGVGKYVLLDLGKHFSVGRVIRTNPYMLTLEVYHGKKTFCPGYSRNTIHKMISIDRRMAEILGPFSYPPYPNNEFSLSAIHN